MEAEGKGFLEVIRRMMFLWLVYCDEENLKLPPIGGLMDINNG